MPNGEPLSAIGSSPTDDSPAFIAKAVRDWIGAVEAKTASIEPGIARENGFCESSDATRILDGEIFHSLKLVWSSPHGRVHLIRRA